MTETAEHDAPENHGVATKAGISEIADKKRQAVGNHVERLAGGTGQLLTETQSALGGLAARGDSTVAIAADRERTVDIVGPNLGASIVGSSFAELYRTEKIGSGRESARNATEGLQLLLSGLALVVLVQNLDIMVMVRGNFKVLLSALRISQGNLLIIMDSNFFALVIGDVDLLLRFRFMSVLACRIAVKACAVCATGHPLTHGGCLLLRNALAAKDKDTVEIKV